MSRVTINDIHNDVVYSANWSQVCDTEIVPRKMVEMIIKDCEKKMEFYGTLRVVCSEDKGAYNTAKSTKEYAESLLKQFEEDE